MIASSYGTVSLPLRLLEQHSTELLELISRQGAFEDTVVELAEDAFTGLPAGLARAFLHFDDADHWLAP